MTEQQRKIVTYWRFAGILIAFVALSFLFGEVAQTVAIWIAALANALGESVIGYAPHKGFGDNSGWVGEVVESHPWLKAWLVFTCLTVVPLLIYKIETTDSISAEFVMFVLGFAIVTAPIVAASEMDRYQAAGEGQK